jgi:hypothetical protein
MPANELTPDLANDAADWSRKSDAFSDERGSNGDERQDSAGTDR